MKYRILIMTVAVLGVLVLASAASACYGRPCGGHGMMMNHGNGNQAGVQLDADQQQQIASIRQKYSGEFTALRGKIEDLETAVSNELSAENPDGRKLKKLQSQRTEAGTEMHSLFDKMNQEIDGVLTDAQKKSSGRYKDGHSTGQHFHHGHGWCGSWDMCPWTW